MEFQIGDRVVAVDGEADGIEIEGEGTITMIMVRHYGVIWDEYNSSMHNLGVDEFEDGHGWWCEKHELEITFIGN